MTDTFGDRYRRGAGMVGTQSVFTNRVDELDRFQLSWLRHRRALKAAPAPDLETGRDNVLHFYGTGGIGKSSLLRHLERGFLTEAPGRASEFIDFDSPSVFDLEEMVLRLRAAVGQLGVRCTAFDFALHFYWSVAHPGESIETYTARHGVLGRLSRRYDVAADMEASVMDIMSSVVEASAIVHGTTKLASAVHRLVRDRSRVKHAIAGCDDLQNFLDPATVEQAIGYLPVLLAWDLQQAGNPEVVVFWDTYEEVQERGRRQEQAIQRICFLMPNVFFVIGGRNRLDWAHESLLGELDFVGPRCWPYLAGQAARSQMLVGDLSDTDSDSYLSDRLVIHGEAAIPPDVRKRIVSAAGGWPLYLDLAAQHYQQAIADGTANDVEVDVPFSALVTRLAADLSGEERAVLRGAALLETFDLDLAHSAAGDVTRGAVESLVSRDFVKRDAQRVWPLSVHATLRLALRRDTTSRDSWTELDWEAAGRRVADRLSQRAAQSRDTRELRACLAQGLSLAHEFALSTEWLSEAARRLAGHGGLSGVRDLGSLQTPAGALSRLCHLVDARSQMSFAHAAQPFDQELVDALSPADRLWVKIRRATALLNLGELRRAADGYAEVVSADDVAADMAVHAQTMFALVQLKRGRFRELAALVEDPESRADVHRLMGDALRYNARWGEASVHYEHGLSASLEEGDPGLARLYRAELALVDGWTGRSDPALRKRPDDTGDSAWGAVTHLIARGLYEAGRDPHTARRLLDDADRAARGHGVHEAAADVAVARGFVAALHDDARELATAVGAADEYTHAAGAHASWTVVLRWWAGQDPGETSVDWLDGPEAARNAWVRTLAERRSGLRDPRTR